MTVKNIREMSPLTMSAYELARTLGVSDSAIYEAVKRDGHVAGVPCIRIGRRYVFSRRAVEAMLRERYSTGVAS